MTRAIIALVVALSCLTSASAQNNPAVHPMVLAKQQKGQWQVRILHNAKVFTSANESVGYVSDVLVTQEGTVAAYIVQIGGFLGIGTKPIAYSPSAFEIVGQESDVDGLKLRFKIPMTSADLKAAPIFEKIH